jgi:hypothetical protein
MSQSVKNMAIMKQNNIPASSESQQYITPPYTQQNVPYIVDSSQTQTAIPPLAEQQNQFMMQPNLPYQQETQNVSQQNVNTSVAQRYTSYNEEGVMATIMYAKEKCLHFLAFWWVVCFAQDFIWQITPICILRIG